jgi:hypothetical protein
VALACASSARPEPRKRNYGLPHEPFKAIIAPRPIGWITSMSAKGEINFAPILFLQRLSAADGDVLLRAQKGSTSGPYGGDHESIEIVLVVPGRSFRCPLGGDSQVSRPALTLAYAEALQTYVAFACVYVSGQCHRNVSFLQNDQRLALLKCDWRHEHRPPLPPLATSAISVGA